MSDCSLGCPRLGRSLVDPRPHPNFSDCGVFNFQHSTARRAGSTKPEELTRFSPFIELDLPDLHHQVTAFPTHRLREYTRSPQASPLFHGVQHDHPQLQPPQHKANQATKCDKPMHPLPAQQPSASPNPHPNAVRPRRPNLPNVNRPRHGQTR